MTMLPSISGPNFTPDTLPLPSRAGKSRPLPASNGEAADAHVIETYWYPAFGDRLTAVSVSATGCAKESGADCEGRYQWAGRELAGETDLQCHAARYYEPIVGRWFAADPLECEQGEMNLYRYPAESCPE